MTLSATPPRVRPQPLSRPLPTLWVGASAAIVVLVLATSLLGLLAPWPYLAETENWRLQAHAQDLGNLVAVVTLLAGLVPAARGSLRGRMVWAGALLYLAYSFVIYAVAVHFGPLFLPYVAVLGLSLYALAFGLRWWDGGVRIEPRPLRFGTVVIAVIAILFALLWLSTIVPALLSGGLPPELAESGLVSNPVHVLDLALVLPGMLVTARLARAGSSAAQVLLGPWLVFSALMAASITLTLAQGGAAVPAVAVGLITLISATAAAAVLRGTRSASVSPSPEDAAAIR